MKIIILSVILCLYSCNSKTNNKNGQDENVYLAKGNFGTIEIFNNKLDSIINSLPYWKLDEFKTFDSKEAVAVQILKEELRNKFREIDKYFIIEIIKEKNGNVAFYLDHINQFVYQYNLEHNPNGVPLTGNATGVEGWYTVDMEKETLSISYAQ